MNNLTVIIYTYNEEKKTKDCIQSVKNLTDNIVIIDLESKDNTTTIAQKEEAEIFSFKHVNYVEPAREFGIRKSKTNWIFLLDADERMTKELANEILRHIQNDTYTHYKIPRKNIFGTTHWLKHGGWWPDHQIRLINKKYFKSWPKEIHSAPIIDGRTGYLKNPILHFFHGDFGSMVSKTITFEDIESNLLFKANKNVYVPTFFRKFLGELYRRFIKHFGFLDGEIGIIESIYQAFSKTITYLYLYEKKINSSSLRPIS